MHEFSDAFSYPYAAVVYLKVISKSGRATISLIAGKSKVAPVKPMSVPRLELSAAVLLARLINFIRQFVPIPASSCYCWTNSTIAHANIPPSGKLSSRIVLRRYKLSSRILHGDMCAPRIISPTVPFVDYSAVN